jgi:hypothetical protein
MLSRTLIREKKLCWETHWMLPILCNGPKLCSTFRDHLTTTLLCLGLEKCKKTAPVMVLMTYALSAHPKKTLGKSRIGLPHITVIWVCISLAESSLHLHNNRAPWAGTVALITSEGVGVACMPDKWKIAQLLLAQLQE